MLVRSWALFAVALVLIVSSASLRAASTTDQFGAAGAVGGDEAFRITDTHPGPAECAVWGDLMAINEPAVETKMMAKIPVHAPAMQQPTPVAPVPTAVLSGGSVLLGAGAVRFVRKLKQG
ncbi:MAG TPA: hypothetical protein VF669_08270 [Tepidisphaeraceae bacterium]|jgi:hypothetical protein